MINFKSIPFLRILLPYLAGIFYVQQAGITPYSHVLFMGSTVLLGASFTFQKYYKPQVYIKKAGYVFCFNLFLFLLAFETCFIYDARNTTDHYTHYMTQDDREFFCTISDLAVNTGKFTKVPIEINGIKHNGVWHCVSGSSILYLKKGQAQSLSCGSSLLVYSGFGSINPPQNPDEFDYKAFLESKQIFHVVYADSSNIYETPSVMASGSLTQLGCLVKEKVVFILRHSGLSQEAFSICTALLVGYDDEIEDSILTGFSHSGTLHVLSVSGMHTGVLYIVLGYVFGIFDKHKRYKWLRCGFITLALLLFALITGFSPSVMRAVLMLILIMVGKTGYRQGNSYNTLLLSAFLLLLYNPLLIKDVGFLLSYLAVFGIMYLYPILDAMYFVKNKLMRWFWSLSLMSVAATVFTLPVSLYYFHQFPLWFMFSNLVIIPMSIGLMAVAALVLVFYKVAVITTWLAVVINGMTSVMLWFTELTDHETYGFIDYISFSKTDALFSILFIIILLRVITHRQYRSVIVALLVIVAWLGTSLFHHFIELRQQELLVFSVKHKPAYVLRIGHTAYMDAEELSEKEFQRFVKPYLLRFSGLRIIPHKSSRIHFKGKSLDHFNRKEQENLNAEADYMIVSYNSRISLNPDQKNKPLVIADCSNSYTFVNKLKEQCEMLDIPFYSVKEQGALSIRTDYNITER